jgi:hypothetical protein
MIAKQTYGRMGHTSKGWKAVFTICIALIAACNPGAAQPMATAIVLSPTIAAPTVQQSLTATAAQPATATFAATTARPATATLPAESTPTPSPLQDNLKNEWRHVFNGVQVLFASCELMYETHTRFQKGEIDTTKAKADLETESFFFTIIYRDFVKWADPSQAVAPFKASLERDMGSFIDLWEQMNSGDIGSPKVTDPLFETCSSFFDTQNSIVNVAMDAGMTQQTADELASEIEELLDDLYSSVRGKN